MLLTLYFETLYSHYLSHWLIHIFSSPFSHVLEIEMWRRLKHVSLYNSHMLLSHNSDRAFSTQWRSMNLYWHVLFRQTLRLNSCLDSKKAQFFFQCDIVYGQRPRSPLFSRVRLSLSCQIGLKYLWAYFIISVSDSDFTLSLESYWIFFWHFL